MQQNDPSVPLVSQHNPSQEMRQFVPQQSLYSTTSSRSASHSTSKIVLFSIIQPWTQYPAALVRRRLWVGDEVLLRCHPPATLQRTLPAPSDARFVVQMATFATRRQKKMIAAKVTVSGLDMRGPLLRCKGTLLRLMG